MTAPASTCTTSSRSPAPPPPPPSAPPRTPTSDSANPTKVFGTGTAAWVDNSPVNIGYLKFDLSPYAGKTITAATLKVRTTSSASAGSGGHDDGQAGE